MTETTDNKRTFVGPDGNTNYFITSPTAEDIRSADWQYSKTYTKCLVEGITTAAEMQDILMRRGIIGPEFEQRAQELAMDLNDKIIRLEEAATLEEKRDLAIEVSIAREELFQWNQRLNGPLSNTCEQISDDARLEYLTSCIVKDETDKALWDSYDSFMKAKDKDLAMRSRFEVMLYVQGLDSNFLDDTPEATAMREVEKDILAKAKEALEAARVLAEEEMAAEEAAKPAPKKPRKRTPAKKPVARKTTKKSSK